MRGLVAFGALAVMGVVAGRRVKWGLSALDWWLRWERVGIGFAAWCRWQQGAAERRRVRREFLDGQKQAMERWKEDSLLKESTK